jgi:integrase/recombinase XerD
MGQLRNRMEADLKIRGYSSGTQKIYLLYAWQYAKHFMRSPTDMGADEVREFWLDMIVERGLSLSSVKQARAGVSFLYRVTLNRPMEVEWVPVPRRPSRLPSVLSGTEIQALIEAVRRPKYRAIFMLMYGGGLRISEACRLRPQHVDSKRMVLRVRGKGNRERLTVLPERLLDELRNYWRNARPQGEWLFPGGMTTGHASPETTRRVFHKAVAAANITKKVTPHSLRHSFATHLIDIGIDVTTVQALLGHKSIRTTVLYTHASVERIARTKSPLDVLGTSAGQILG